MGTVPPAVIMFHSPASRSGPSLETLPESIIIDERLERPFILLWISLMQIQKIRLTYTSCLIHTNKEMTMKMATKTTPMMPIVGMYAITAKQHKINALKMMKNITPDDTVINISSSPPNIPFFFVT